MAGTASSDPDERLAAWTELAEADPTSLQARSSLYTSWLQEAARCGQQSEPGAVRRVIHCGVCAPHMHCKHSPAS